MKDKIQSEAIKVEDNGFLVFIDLTPCELKEEVKMKVEIKKENKEIKEAEFTKFFEQYVPFNFASPKHEYTVELTRALYSEESYEVYCKYQKHVHGEHKV